MFIGQLNAFVGQNGRNKIQPGGFPTFLPAHRLNTINFPKHYQAHHLVMRRKSKKQYTGLEEFLHNQPMSSLCYLATAAASYSTGKVKHTDAG
jgi:hypothetical protein